MLPLLFLPIVGLSIDAGLLFDARRDLQTVADGAARAGGMELDTQRLDRLRGGDGQVRLHPQHARDAANAYLDAVRVPGGFARDVHIVGDGEAISVTVFREVQPTFLRLLHVRAVQMRAASLAQPCSGLLQGTCPGAGGG